MGNILTARRVRTGGEVIVQERARAAHGGGRARGVPRAEAVRVSSMFLPGNRRAV